MDHFRFLPMAGALKPGASVVIEDGFLRDVHATLLGFAHNGILVAVTLANGLTAFVLEASSVRLGSGGTPLPVH